MARVLGNRRGATHSALWGVLRACSAPQRHVWEERARGRPDGWKQNQACKERARDQEEREGKREREETARAGALVIWRPRLSSSGRCSLLRVAPNWPLDRIRFRADCGSLLCICPAVRLLPDMLRRAVGSAAGASDGTAARRGSLERSCACSESAMTTFRSAKRLVLIAPLSFICASSGRMASRARTST